MKVCNFEKTYSRILECFDKPDDMFDYFKITQADIDNARQRPGDHPGRSRARYFWSRICAGIHLQKKSSPGNTRAAGKDTLPTF